jgi:Bardet-Biedl syndrome 9 protein
LPSDLLLETQMAEPILQVAIGHFLPGAPNALAVLHPRCLEVYQVTRPRTAADDEVPFLELQRLRLHSIPHTAANFCYGRFGRETPADDILVQAYDGQIYIFEAGNLIQTTYLEDFLVPGPIQYVAETDSVITCSSAFELQCYSYMSLVQASQTKSEADTMHSGHALSKRKTPSPQWKLLIGELAVDIHLAPSDTQEDTCDIIVVGERSVVTCSQDGVLKSQRRLEYHPAAVTSYK